MSLAEGRAASAVRRTWREEQHEIAQVVARMMQAADGAGDVLAALGGGSARGLLDAIEQHVLPYLDWEEAIFHPVIDRVAGSPLASRLLRRQLRQVRGRIQRVEADWSVRRLAPTRRELRDVREHLRDLATALRAHLEQQDRILAPMLGPAGA